MVYSIETLKSFRSDAKNNRRIYINRRDELRKPYNNGFEMDDYYSKIKNKIDDCTTELRNGIKGMSSLLEKKCSTIDEKKEGQPLSQQYSFWQSLTYMTYELNRCQENINYFDNLMVNYERQIKEQGGVIFPWE